MRGKFSEYLQKAIKEKKVEINEQEKIAILFQRNFFDFDKVGAILANLKWVLGVKSELQNKGYTVKFE